MNPFLSSHINDEHRSDLLREADAERLAHQVRQARARTHISSKSGQTGVPDLLISVDTLLLLAGRYGARRERVAYCSDEAI